MVKTNPWIHFLPLACLLAALPAPAAPPADGNLPVLEELVVTGIQPGPGLWKVSRDGRVLWVLATLAPLPKRMEWSSDEVRERIAASGVVLLSPRVSLKTRGGLLGGVFLLPSALRARNNPEGQTLQDVLPAQDYARWELLKARYIGRDRGVEKRRPIAAAMELREDAFDRHGLSWRDVVGREVKRAARRGDVPVREPTVTLKVDNARAALKEFSRSQVDDLECFRLTLDQVEHDLETLATRANAWAMGEVGMLLDLPYTDNSQACLDALLQTGLAQDRGLNDLPARVEATWLAEARAALAEHPESFAVLPMSRVVGERSYLRVLQQDGYTVEAPSSDP
ncbi:MAG: TraB/GumN family protein [Pseudoxanthomonas sp.]|nr:TraB/GumN family protein [Pseudoxanthomonas sp.]